MIDEKTTAIITKFGSSDKCNCNCSVGGDCEHDFNGGVMLEFYNHDSMWQKDYDKLPEEEQSKLSQSSGSVVCLRCGMSAMAHDTAGGGLI